MSLQKYRAFVKVVELQSVTKAAEAMQLSQSAVSHILNGLEEEMGFSLMIRSRKGIQLTENGEKILPVVRGILNEQERLRQVVAQLHKLDIGTVRIGTFTSVAVHWLPQIIKSFQELYPNIEFKLLNGDYHDVEQWLEGGAVDLGFVALPSNTHCNCTPLMEDRLLAILPLDHPLASLPRFPIGMAKHEPFISLLESSDHDTRRALDAEGIRPNVKFITKDDYAIIAMVENGLGISIMPELLLQGRTDRVCALELAPQAKRTIGLAITETGENSPSVRLFADFIIEWVRRKSKPNE